MTDLTVAAAGEHADVLRVTPLGSHDSSYVYFVAEGVLASNTREFTNGEGKTVVEGAEAGNQNLYLWNGEKTTFIATDLSYNGPLGLEQTSPDGKWLSFESERSLTGYDNVAPNNKSATELFLYHAASGQLACASCNPTGEPPIAGSDEGGLTSGDSEGSEERGGGVVPFRQGIEEEAYGVSRPSRHLLTDAGQVFFDTNEALVPSDTDGLLDVYEYENGQPSLISSGTSSFDSNLEDASESGNDVFFRSNQQLVPQDNQEGEIVIYDARVDGGIAESPSPPACTTADACRTPVLPQPSIYGAPASQTFSGVGNLTPPPPPPGKTTVKKVTKCKKGFNKSKKEKCVRKKTKKSKKSKKAKKSSYDRRANR